MFNSIFTIVTIYRLLSNATGKLFHIYRLPKPSYHRNNPPLRVSPSAEYSPNLEIIPSIPVMYDSKIHIIIKRSSPCPMPTDNILSCKILFRYPSTRGLIPRDSRPQSLHLFFLSEIRSPPFIQSTSLYTD